MKIQTSLVLSSGALLILLASSYSQTTFTKITTDPVVTDAADGEGCAWVDFNGDGRLDLYVSCDQTGANLLYRNDGNGVFTKITTGPIVNAGTRSVSASWADIDNDGRIDLFVSRQSGQGLLFRQQQDGSFTQSSLPSGGFSWGSAWADYDNDGFVDLLVADTTQSVLWHNNGQGVFSAVTSTPIVTTAPASTITWADYNNDGIIDLFVANDGSNSRLYRNDGRGLFTALTNGPLANQSANATGAAWGDYDNDGFPDLFLVRLDTSFQRGLPSFLFHNDGNGTFTIVEQSPFTNDLGYSVGCSWGDYDNDGWLDLIVGDFRGNGNRLYHNNGDGTFSRVLSGSIATDHGNTTGVIWGDYDRDGFLDLFAANGNGGAEINDYLYHNDGNSNAWITIKCVGTRSNRSAIGTKVRVGAAIGGTNLWQMREINSGDGWSQNPLEAHFGLGDATNVLTLRIEWPSGTVQEFQNVAARQYLMVTEPARLNAVFAGDASAFTLHGGRGRQYEIQNSTNLMQWASLDTITITNFDGRIVITDTNASSSQHKFYRALLR